MLCLNALLLAVFFGGIAIGYFGRVMEKSPLMFQDFTRYYTFGWIARSPQRADLYDPVLQFARQVDLLRAHYHGAIPMIYSWPIDYTPPLAIVMAPVTIIPFPFAMLACQLLGLAAAGFSIYLLRGRGWRDAIYFVSGVALCVFSWRALAIGQLTWLIVGGVGLYFYCLLRGRSILAGLLLALLAVIKVQYAVYFAIPLLPLIERKAIVAGAGMTLALIVASGLVLGWDAVWIYPSLLMHTQSHDPGINSMICLRALVDIVLHRPLSSIAAVVIALSGMGMTFAMWWKVRKNSYSTSWAVAATIGLSIVTNFHAHNFDSLLLAIAAAVTLPTLDPFSVREMEDRITRVWCWSVLSLPMLSWIVMKIPDAFEVARCAVLVLVATYITALAVWQFWRSPKLAQSPH